MIKLEDTIAAVATPPGEGGVGIVRISGPAAFSIADRLFQPVRKRLERSSSPEPRIQHPKSLVYGLLLDPETHETVDDVLLLRFRRPHSYTGEDVVEFSCHGGPVTLARVLRLTLEAGARYAEPGEFTQRAFLNGRMDLAQAEAVCDQIRARTEAQQRLAVGQREGALSRRVKELKDDLVGALAAVEVTIDFSDEVGDLDYGLLAERLSRIEEGLEELCAIGERGRVYREGVRLAIVGQPNVGKSSLMNALLRQERAIVTPIPGTTRDTIEETANIQGIPIVAIDTAGLRETDDPVEQIGVERARAAIETASLVLLVVDAPRGWTEDDRSILHQVSGRPCLGVLNKIDQLSEARRQRIEIDAGSQSALSWLPVSAATGEGLESLESAIAETVVCGGVEASALVVTNARHLHELRDARESVRLSRETAARRLPPDFISIDLRGALDALGRITGETATDEIIHRIFHDFCVGK